MKTINLLLAIVVFAIIDCRGQTSVPAGNVSGIWTLVGSPYNVQGSITIADTTTLTIQPGVTVNFQGTYRLNVQGRLLAIGTSTDTIFFTATNTSIGWRSIYFDNTLATNDTSKIYFCKLQYGKATSSAGGAFYFNNFSKAIISNCLISNCLANSYGGGIYCRNSGPLITRNTITNNTISNIYGNGAGIYCDTSSSPIIFNNTIFNNFTSSNGDGGGIYCNNSSPTIVNNTISNNTASDGGGIYCNASNVTITNNIISNNIVSVVGGGVICFGGSSVISNNTLSNNIASYGSGIHIQNANSTISNNTISNNTASGSGGAGIYCESSTVTITNNTINNNSDNSPWGGGGISCGSSTPSTNISNNIISNNSTLGDGGGIECFINSNPTISNNTFVNNNAANGGAIYCTNSSPTFINNSIVNNNATSSGGGLYCSNGSNPIFRNTILWGNTASTSGMQVSLHDQASKPNFYYCDVQGSSTGFELNGNTYAGTYQNNIDIDPLLISPSGGSGNGFNGLAANWSLQGTTPCLDAGTPNIIYPATDIVGNPRISGCHIDMGAYEYQTGVFPPHFSQNLSICNGHSINVGTHTYTASGNYIDVLTSFNNCDSTVTTNLTVDSIDLSVSVLAATLTANVTGATYQWINCSGNLPIPGQTNQNFVATIDGNYAVIITKNSCSDTSTCYNISTTGIFENTFASTINIYPNPFDSQTSISFDNEQKNTLIKIIDVLGKEVRSINFSGKQLLIEKGEMQKGIYFLQIIDDNKNLISRKLIVQ